MSLGAWWLALKTNKKLVLNILVGVALFAAGWQLGRVMSPYYAAHPIIFQENGSVAGGSPDELVELLEEGRASTAASSKQQVAGDQRSYLQPSPRLRPAGTQSEELARGRFVGSKNFNKYHAVPECATWKQIKTANQIWFADQAEAQSAGYVPTSCTSELLGL